MNNTSVNGNAPTPVNESVPDWMKCKEPSPNSAELLRRLTELGPNAIGAMCVPPILLAIMVALFIDEMVYFFRQSLSWRRKILYCWILGTFPALSVLNVIGLFIPTSSKLVDFASSFYFAISIKKFFDLILHFHGGKKRMVEALQGQKIVPANPFPCCFVCCCHHQPMTVTRINIMQVLAYQATIILPLVYFVQSLLSAEGYAITRRGGILITIVGFVGTVSGFTALYSFVVMSKSSRTTLQQYQVRGKYLSIQLVVAVKSIQRFLLRVLQRFDKLSCGFPYPDRETSYLFHSYLFTCELFLLSILAWFAFRRSEVDCQVVMTEETAPNSKQIAATSFTCSSAEDTE